jgi:glycosyltransferase involved in cell wall biosynthesis
VLPTVSVVIPAWRAASHLAAGLRALARQERPPHEVLVVDDASPDETAAVAVAEGARVLRHDTNRGAAAARNTGARAARGEVLLFLDSDVVAHPGAVAAVERAFRAPEVVAATGRYAPEPANDDAFARYKALWTWFAWEQTAGRTGESGHLQGAIAAIRRDAFLITGGFDESYQGGSVEDYEISRRIRADGHRIHFLHDLLGRHHFPGYRTVARNYWDRSRMWTRLLQDERAFSSGQANARSALASALALGGAAARIGLPWTLPLVVALDGAWLLSSGPFLLFVARRAGLPFAARSAAWHWSLGVVAAAGALTSPFGQGSRLTSSRSGP